MEHNTDTTKIDIGEGVLAEATSYQLQNYTFLVEPVFAKEGGESLGDVLLRLIKSEIDNS